MSGQFIVSLSLAAAATTCLLTTVVHERRMQRHRRTGVSWSEATMRCDGGWRRGDLFTDEGLHHQRRAARWGALGTLLLLAALSAWIAAGMD
ncbi:MAG: hypothetical protein H0W68_14740 [Gemmatimonadaceae bacterium]|nr:hypothetical protein [Gemmatimonadaceae bacterium]